MQAAGDRQRRLLAAIVSDPPPRAELVASLAEAARLGAARPGRGGRPRREAAGRAPAAARRARRLDRPGAVPARAGPGRPGTAGGDRPGPERLGPCAAGPPRSARRCRSPRGHVAALGPARAGAGPRRGHPGGPGPLRPAPVHAADPRRRGPGRRAARTAAWRRWPGCGPASATGSPRRCWPGCSSARTPQRSRSGSTSTRRRSGTGCGRSTSCSATSCAIRTVRFELQLALRIRHAGRRANRRAGRAPARPAVASGRTLRSPEMKAGHPSDRRRRWPTEGDRNRSGLDSFASAAPQRQPQGTGPLCRPSGVRVVVVWRPVQQTGQQHVRLRAVLAQAASSWPG